MEGREEYSPLDPNDKTIPSPLGLGIEHRGEGVVVVGGGFGFAYWGCSEGDRQCVCGERCEYSCTFIH